jgi:hypothetical protein
MEEKRRAAQRRAAREAVARAQAALEQLRKLEAATPPSERQDLRIGSSEAEARKMKQGDGGVAPSYTVQVSTEAQSRMIVAVGLTTAACDTGELMPAVERVEQNCERETSDGDCRWRICDAQQCRAEPCSEHRPDRTMERRCLAGGRSAGAQWYRGQVCPIGFQSVFRSRSTITTPEVTIPDAPGFSADTR